MNSHLPGVRSGHVLRDVMLLSNLGRLSQRERLETRGLFSLCTLLLLALGGLGCGSDPGGSGSETANETTEPGPLSEGSEQVAIPPASPQPSTARAGLVPRNYSGHPFALNYRPEGGWELAVQQINQTQRTVSFHPVNGREIGAARLGTSYAGAGTDAILSLESGDNPKVVRPRFDESSAELLVHDIQTGTITQVGALGVGDELHRTLTDDIHVAVSRFAPFEGIAAWRSAEQTLAHHAIPNGHATVITSERRRLRVATFGEHSSLLTLSPWGPVQHPCGARQGLSSTVVARTDEAQAVSWAISTLSDECVAQHTLKVARLSAGRVRQTMEQPIPAELTRTSLGMMIGGDGSVVVVRQGHTSSRAGGLVGLLSFDSSGTARAPTTLPVSGSSLIPFPVMQCANGAWLPFLNSNDDGTLVLSTLRLPLDGSDLSAPVRRWESAVPARCRDSAVYSLCVGGEAAVASSCVVPGEDDGRILFVSWRLDDIES